MVATVNGKPVAIYAYDALGRRVSEFLNASSPAETRHCYYSDQWQVIEERVQTAARSTTGRPNVQYVWSPVSVDALIERDRDSNGDAILDERVYALQDANWNVTALVAGPGVSGYAVGAIINRFAYTPYGTTQVMTPSWTAAPSTAIPWKHTFQGLAGNTFTGLYDARNRDYSPTLGRFIEPDPIGFQAGDNNFYRFVGNGPVGRTDAMGLYVDIAVEIVSIGTGLHSFGMNVWAGQWTAAGVDAVGIVIDVGLSVVPGAPGATGLAIKTGREAAELTGRRFVGREAAEQATRIVGNAAEQSAKKDATKGVVSNGFRSSCEADVGDASQFGVRAKGSGSGPHDATSPRTGKWGRGSFGSASESLVEHFATHGAEVGAKDIDQYLRKAEAFAQNLRGATKSAVDGATPGTTRYKKLGKYIDIDRNGHIISFGGQ
jgi:RHS repeat-associated protein